MSNIFLNKVSSPPVPISRPAKEPRHQPDLIPACPDSWQMARSAGSAAPGARNDANLANYRGFVRGHGTTGKRRSEDKSAGVRRLRRNPGKNPVLTHETFLSGANSSGAQSVPICSGFVGNSTLRMIRQHWSLRCGCGCGLGQAALHSGLPLSSRFA